MAGFIKTTVIIPAAGQGKRMGSDGKKQYLNLKGKPILVHTLEVFDKCTKINNIILVVGKGEVEYCKEEIVKKYKINKISNIVEGGKERQDSVYEGLKKIPDETDIVLVHDAARPFVKEVDIHNIITQTVKNKACVLGVKAKDTIKIVNKNNKIVDTPNRDLLWLVQTPQVFSKDIIMSAYNKAMVESFKATDDSMIVERYSDVQVKMVEGSYSNIKITTQDDLIIGERFLN